MILRTVLLSMVFFTLRQVAAQTCPADDYLDSNIQNLARRCGVNRDQACAAHLSTTLGTNTANKGNDDILNNHANFASTQVTATGIGTSSNRHWFQIDLGIVRRISYLVFYNHDNWNQANGAQVQANTFESNSNPVCATLNGGGTQTHICAVFARYVRIVQPVLANNNILNLKELQIFSGGCTKCPGTLLSQAGSTMASHCGCPSNAYSQIYVIPVRIDTLLRLDSMRNTMWAAPSSTPSVLQIDTGANYIVNVVTQGLATSLARVAASRIEYRVTPGTARVPLKDGDEFFVAASREPLNVYCYLTLLYLQPPFGSQ